MPPSGGFGNAHHSGLCSSRGKDVPCRRKGCAGVRVDAAATAVGKEPHRQRQRHVLKAQMTDEEMALDQVKAGTTCGRAVAPCGPGQRLLRNEGKVCAEGVVYVTTALECLPWLES